jgi:hypothetical protein
MKVEDLPRRQQELLEQWRTAYEAGDGAALLNAVEFVLNCGVVPPPWVCTGFNAAWQVRYGSGLSRTLDDAFNVRRPLSWSQKSARKEVLRNIVWQHVVAYTNQGEAIDGTLFAKVADELNEERSELFRGLKFSQTVVSNAYYAVKRRADLQKKTKKL